MFSLLVKSHLFCSLFNYYYIYDYPVHFLVELNKWMLGIANLM